MSDANDDLRKRILDDQPAGGDAWRDALIARFNADRKKLLVHATLWLLACVAILCFGAWLLDQASDLKLMLLAVVVMLIGYESTVLIKLWYWVAETNTRVTREIKQLQLLTVDRAQGEAPTEPRAQASGPPSEPGAPATGQALPPARAQLSEGGFWARVSQPAVEWLCVAVLAVAGVACTYFYLIPLGRSGGPLAEREEHTRILPDGRCEILTREQYPYAGMTPMHSIQFRADRPLEDPTWHEAGQGALPHSVAQADGAWIYNVRLPQPIFRGEKVDLRSTATVAGLAVLSEPRAHLSRRSQMAEPEASGPLSEPRAQASGPSHPAEAHPQPSRPGARASGSDFPRAQASGPSEPAGPATGQSSSGLWTYTSDPNWSTERPPALTVYSARSGPLKRSVTLPPGGFAESVTPQPKMQWGDYDGSNTLYFETAPEAPAEPIRITYRLYAGKPMTQPAAGAEVRSQK